MGNAQTAIGSWQLSLTSVAPGDAGTSSGLSYFTPHGTFTATMVAADGSLDTATLTVLSLDERHHPTLVLCQYSIVADHAAPRW